ncbi:MAG: RHS repeat-associated core domain-containing protein, partial [Bacteroidetes bacterium]
FFYLPFGEVAVHQHANNDGYSNPYKFSSSEFDDATGLILMGARYYDPMFSLWMSADPMSVFRSRLTPYNYVANNPVMFVDPSGLLESSINTGDGDPCELPEVVVTAKGPKRQIKGLIMPHIEVKDQPIQRNESSGGIYVDPNGRILGKRKEPGIWVLKNVVTPQQFHQLEINTMRNPGSPSELYSAMPFGENIRMNHNIDVGQFVLDQWVRQGGDPKERIEQVIAIVYDRVNNEISLKMLPTLDASPVHVNIEGVESNIVTYPDGRRVSIQKLKSENNMIVLGYAHLHENGSEASTPGTTVDGHMSDQENADLGNVPVIAVRLERADSRNRPATLMNQPYSIAVPGGQNLENLPTGGGLVPYLVNSFISRQNKP